MCDYVTVASWTRSRPLSLLDSSCNTSEQNLIGVFKNKILIKETGGHRQMEEEREVMIFPVLLHSYKHFSCRMSALPV